jgi:hypothetical protein
LARESTLGVVWMLRTLCYAFEEAIAMFEPGQSVRVNLAGIQVGDVLFHQAVTAAVGKIVRRTQDEPPKYLVRLLFSFRGVSEVEVAEDRILAS